MNHKYGFIAGLILFVLSFAGIANGFTPALVLIIPAGITWCYSI